MQGSLIKVPIPAGPAGPLLDLQVELGGGFEVGGSVDMPGMVCRALRKTILVREYGDDL